MRSVGLFLALGLGLTAASPQQKVFPLRYDQHDLTNQLRLITVPTDFPNIVALFVVVSAGSRNEVEPGKSGFAHFFEHLMFRGTKAYPPEKYRAVLKRAGASSNAFTSDDLTVYHATFSKEDLEPIMAMQADRFQHLEYGESAFRTEALAVLGEYNKNSSSPPWRIDEVLRNTAYDKHTYKHTTIGFLADIQDMPNQYEYSKMFFDRFYRPEYVTIIVVGDVNIEQTRSMVTKYWGNWKRGDYKPEIGREPEQKSARSSKVPWPGPTLPWTVIAYKVPAYSDTDKDYAALIVAGAVAFSESSDIYKKLVLQQKLVDDFSGSLEPHRDPYLFAVWARVKKQQDIDTVTQEVLKTTKDLQDRLVATDRLDLIKRNLRYQFATGLDSSDSIASTLARYVALKRTPETINTLYETLASLTPEDIRSAARRYLINEGRTIINLSGASAK